MTERYPFPKISQHRTREYPLGGKIPLSATDMTKALKVYTRNAGEPTAFTMHFFRSGGALTHMLAGEDLPTIIAMRILEEVKYGGEIPQTHGSTDSRIFRKLHGSRGVTRTVQLK